MNVPEEKLIDQLLSSSEKTRRKGWKAIYQSVYPMIRDMVVKNNGSKQEALDIFQDGMAILYKNLKDGRFRNESELNTYIFSICKNLWLKEHDRKYKQSLLEPELILEAKQNHHYIINSEIVSLLMNELEDDCRRILTEYYFHNRSMAELKDMFSVNSIQAAKNKKHRCFKYLKRLFKEKGVTPTWN